VVATTWSGSAFYGTDGSTFSSLPLGFCNLRFCFNGERFFAPAVIFAQSAADLILGWDFLSSNAFVVECLSQPSLPFFSSSYFSASSDASELPNLRASLITSHVLPPLSAVYVSLEFSNPLPDVTQVLLAPLRFVLSKHSVLAPYAVVTVKSNACVLPVFNLLSSAQLLPSRLKLVDADVLPATALLCTVQTHTAVSPPNSLLQSGNLPFNIDSSLSVHHRTELMALLNTFSHLFNSQNSKLGQALGVQHRIDTGTAPPIRQRLYRHSATERKSYSRSCY